MANLTTTAQTIKKILPFLGIFLLFSLLIAAIFFRYRQPKISLPTTTPIPPPTIIQHPSQTSSPALDFSQAPIPQIPDQLPVFTAQKIVLSDSFAQSLATSFSITSDPFLIEENTLSGKQYTFRKGEVSLAINENTIRYENYNSNLTPENKLTEAELENTALTFAQQVPTVGDNLTLNRSLTKFLKIKSGGFEDSITSASSFQDANLVEYFLDKSPFPNIPLIGPTPETTFANVRINKSGEILYFRSMLSGNFIEQDLYKLKPPDEATSAVTKGSGKIMETLLLDENNQANELFRSYPISLEAANITNIYLAYFMPENLSEQIQPIYVFEGKFQNELTQNGKIVIYLPATKI